MPVSTTSARLQVQDRSITKEDRDNETVVRPYSMKGRLRQFGSEAAHSLAQDRGPVTKSRSVQLTDLVESTPQVETSLLAGA
jgi:hypothetical protein